MMLNSSLRDSSNRAALLPFCFSLKVARIDFTGFTIFPVTKKTIISRAIQSIVVTVVIDELDWLERLFMPFISVEATRNQPVLPIGEA